MYTCDFEYDGKLLSDFGFIICDFNGSSDFDTVDAGSKIQFNTVSRHRGKIFSLVGTEYSESVTATIDICKDPSLNDDLQITNDEYRALVRWLNRSEFLRFRLIYGDDDRTPCYYDASFNIEKVMVGNVLYGLELSMETNKPFGYGEELIEMFDISDTAEAFSFTDASDEIGYTYPNLKITFNESGDFSLINDATGCNMQIKNVSVGEIITIKGAEHIIASSLSSHKIYDDFNFDFFTVGNSYQSRENKITASLKCDIKLSYSPIIKNSPN